ncbi:MAG: SH3 domain-containing protein [Anaerolineae bacterium]|nr:SH3 domain-containing protein [Anaerolineae bacterium]
MATAPGTPTRRPSPCPTAARWRWSFASSRSGPTPRTSSSTPCSLRRSRRWSRLRKKRRTSSPQPTLSLKVRSGAGLEHSILTVVNPGDRLTVLEDWVAASAKLGVHGEWINLRAPDGVAGWSAAWILEPFAEGPPEAAEHFLTPTDFELKVRSGAGLEHSILSVVNPGDRLAVLEDWAAASAKLGVHGEWINLRAPDGVAGWSAAWILKPFAETPPPTDGLYPAAMNAFQVTQPFSGADGHWGIDYGATKGEPVFCGRPAGS